MWAKVLELNCDTDICDETIQREGKHANKKDVMALARNLGWTFSRDGYAKCQECNYTGRDVRND